MGVKTYVRTINSFYSHNVICENKFLSALKSANKIEWKHTWATQGATHENLL